MRASPKMALLILPKGWLAGEGQKQMCHCAQAVNVTFHLILFLLQNFLWVGKKKNKTLWVGNVCRDLSSLSCLSYFCLIGYCQFVVLVVCSASA